VSRDIRVPRHRDIPAYKYQVRVWATGQCVIRVRSSDKDIRYIPGIFPVSECQRFKCG